MLDQVFAEHPVEPDDESGEPATLEREEEPETEPDPRQGIFELKRPPSPEPGTHLTRPCLPFRNHPAPVAKGGRSLVL